MSDIRSYLKRKIDLSTSLSIVSILALFISLPLSLLYQSKGQALFKSNLVKAVEPNASLTISAAATQEINVPFDVLILLNTDSAKVKGVDAAIEYDPAMLQLMNVTPVAHKTTTFKTFTPMTKSGVFDAETVLVQARETKQIKFSALTYGHDKQQILESFNGVTQLAILKFKPLKVGSTMLSFTYTPSSTTDTNIITSSDPPTDLLTQPSQLLNAQVLIEGPTVSPTSVPSIVPSSTPTNVPIPTLPVTAGVPKCMRYNLSLGNFPKNAYGTGIAQVDTVNNALTYKFTFKNLTGPATAAHIHGFIGRSGSAGALYTINIPSASAGSANGVWNYQESQEADILKGLSYINIHTSQNPNGEISGWLDGGVPCIPTGLTTLPLCTNHDPTKYHGLIDPVNNCHYNHEHKENPHDADDIFGPPGKWWSDAYTAASLGNIPAQEISYPWLTANGLENLMYKDAAGNIIGGKHESYGWLVRKDLPISAGYQGNTNNQSRKYFYIKNARLQTHMDLHAQGTKSRYHSYMLEAQLCVKQNPSDCGIVRLGGWGDYEELNVDGSHVVLPGIDPPIPESEMRGSISRRDHESKTRGNQPHNDSFADWYMVRKNEYKAPFDRNQNTLPLGTPLGYTTFDIHTTDSFTNTNPTNPSDVNNLVCANFQCLQNNSEIAWGRLLIQPHNMAKARDASGHYNFYGFTDHYGNELAGACYTQGCVPTTKCTPGPDCVPMQATHLPEVDDPGAFEDRRANILNPRDYDTSPAAVGLGSAWWIEFPN